MYREIVHGSQRHVYKLYSEVFGPGGLAVAPEAGTRAPFLIGGGIFLSSDGLATKLPVTGIISSSSIYASAPGANLA